MSELPLPAIEAGARELLGGRQDDEPRWSHCANSLRSHAPVLPAPELRWTAEDAALCAVCGECGYLIWLVPDWEKWPSRTTPDDGLRPARTTPEGEA